MAKTLLLCTHPEYRTPKSEHIKKIFDRLSENENIIADYLPDDGNYDQEEQWKLMDQADNIILLFPINWFNIPWTLSKYIARSWNSKHSLNKRHIYLIITGGGKKDMYETRMCGYNVDEFLGSLKATIKTCDGKLAGEWIYYAAGQDKPENFAPFVENMQKVYKEIIEQDKE